MMGYLFAISVLSSEKNMQRHTHCLHVLYKSTKRTNTLSMTKKITFTLPADVVAEATSGLLLGEFNNWDHSAGLSLKKQKDGSMKATAALEAGKTYQYRYLLNDGRWVNDQTAETYAHVSGYQVENCVITIPAAAETKPAKAASAKAKKEVKAATAPVTADDITKIEGIGAKIAELLAAENINTFAILSKATAKKLKSILDAAGSKFQMHNPASWPKQAKLAAAGKWDELAKLQDELKGGK
jgi:predicted flap endonuclease-1-like 5' DNA nuclease